MLNIKLYAGKDFPLPSEHGQAHAVVMTLMEKANLLNKGHHFFTYKFYTKPILAKKLDAKATMLTRTAEEAESWRIEVLPPGNSACCGIS